MLAIAIAAVVIAVLAAGFFVLRAQRRRQARLAVVRDKMDRQVQDHRHEADVHATKAAELGPQVEAHREAAAEHARLAEELEERVVREGRAAAFHDRRAAESEEQRERL